VSGQLTNDRFAPGVQFQVGANKATGHGISGHFPCFLLLYTRSSFQLHIKLWSKIVGGFLNRLVEADEVEQSITIDPSEWSDPPAPYVGWWQLFLLLANWFSFDWAWKVEA
jgi:hypothetical protein